VAFPADAVEGIAERRFSVLHTALAASLLAAGGYLVRSSLRGAFGGGEGDGAPGNTR
jgi:hypothetical protein